MKEREIRGGGSGGLGPDGTETSPGPGRRPGGEPGGGRRGRLLLGLALGLALVLGPLVPAVTGPVAGFDGTGTVEAATAAVGGLDLPGEAVGVAGAQAAGEAAGQDAGHDDGQEGDHAAAEEDGHEEEGHGLPYARIFLILISILLVGKLLGEAAERIGQPSVLGELVAGVVLGGSVLGVIPPLGTEIGDIVHVFAEIGVAILLFEIGLETDLKEMFRVGTSAAAVALVGITLPFVMGFVYWYAVDPQIGVHPEGITFWMVAIFVGATLTATSVGITARVLSDLDKMHTSEARIIIGAAVIDDVLGIVILAVVAGMAAGTGAPEAVESFFMSLGLAADSAATAAQVTDILRILLFAVGYLVLAVWIGNKAAPFLFDLVDRMRVRGVLLVSAFSFALLLAALADLSGSAMIIGAFAAGIVLSSTNQFDTVVQRVEPVADIFTPIFFVVVGAPVNVNLFIPGAEDFDINVLGVGLVLTAIAIVSKLLAGWATRRSELNRFAIGAGMIPRGEVGLIFASIGLTGGILSSAAYSAILIMVILSTFVVPPFLKGIFARGGSTVPGAVEGGPAEPAVEPDGAPNAGGHGGAGHGAGASREDDGS